MLKLPVEIISHICYLSDDLNLCRIFNDTYAAKKIFKRFNRTILKNYEKTVEEPDPIQWLLYSHFVYSKVDVIDNAEVLYWLRDNKLIHGYQYYYNAANLAFLENRVDCLKFWYDFDPKHFVMCISSYIVESGRILNTPSYIFCKENNYNLYTFHEDANDHN